MENWYIKTPLYATAKTMVKAGRAVFCFGHAGCGKSEMFRQIAVELGINKYEVSGNSEMRPDDFLGYKTIEGNNVKWIDGLLPKAAREGALLIINEISSVHPGVLFALHYPLEQDGKVVLPENGGEEITPTKGFCIACTDNTNGLGNVSGMYSGTEVLNQAFLDRFEVLQMDYLSPKDEQKLLLTRFPGKVDKEDAEKLIEVAKLIRDSNKKGTNNILFSTRRLVNLVSTIGLLVDDGITPAMAFKIAVSSNILNKLDDVDAGTVRQIFQRVMPDIEV